MEEEAILTQTNCHALKKSEGNGMHQVILPFVSLLDPLILFLRQEWGLLIESIFKIFVFKKAHGTAHVKHLFVGRVITYDRRQASEDIFIFWVVILPNELLALRLWNVLKKSAHCLVMRPFVESFNIL